MKNLKSQWNWIKEQKDQSQRMLNQSSSQASMDPWTVLVNISFFTHSGATIAAHPCLNDCCMHYFFLVTESNIEVRGI